MAISKLERLNALLVKAGKKELRKAPRNIDERIAELTPKRGQRVIPAGHFTVADLARELGVNPKIARANMRRKASKFGFEQSDDGWMFADKHRDAIAALIQGREPPKVVKKPTARKPKAPALPAPATEVTEEAPAAG